MRRKEYSDASLLEEQNLRPNNRSNKPSANYSDAQQRRAVKNLPKKLKVLPPPGLSAIKANEMENKIAPLAPEEHRHYYQGRMMPAHVEEMSRKQAAKNKARSEKKTEKRR